ncbi:RES family NAD+ phosphorylase [Vibrio harveyi]|uniref:RES family NAD+ phosphorylase n=1 Tax=Vibrio harveyi TaxID=669 RepID=UPI0015599A12|nr:RES family NAD+ phosphorylase [Vibrio harveyi]
MEENLVCSECIGEEFLSKKISNLSIQTCDYCSESAPCTTVKDISSQVEDVLAKYFKRTPENPETWQEAALRDKESDYEWYRDGEPLIDVIRELLEVSQQLAEDVLELLPEKSTYDDFDECAHDGSAHYIESRNIDPDWEAMWRNLETSIKSEARFFNQTATQVLDDVFSNIDDLKTHTGSPVIVMAGPQTTIKHLFRARVHGDDAALHKTLSSPDIELGPPPSSLATAGRMNPRGVSCFYGALEKSTAISEVRPFVGSYVVVGKFEVIRPLKLVDISALRDIRAHGSLFDSDYYRADQQAIFLETLSNLISRPIQPHEAELEYLTTQLVAEYLGVKWDGIIFSSSQTVKPSKNTVLFHKASKVATIDKEQYSYIKVNLFDTDEDSHYFSPTVTKVGFESNKPPIKNGDNELPAYESAINESSGKERVDTLKVDGENLTVEVIKGVNYVSESHKVTDYCFVFNDDELF